MKLGIPCGGPLPGPPVKFKLGYWFVGGYCCAAPKLGYIFPDEGGIFPPGWPYKLGRPWELKLPKFCWPPNQPCGGAELEEEAGGWLKLAGAGGAFALEGCDPVFDGPALATSLAFLL